jgi:hypothetical protein
MEVAGDFHVLDDSSVIDDGDSYVLQQCGTDMNGKRRECQKHTESHRVGKRAASPRMREDSAVTKSLPLS